MDDRALWVGHVYIESREIGMQPATRHFPLARTKWREVLDGALHWLTSANSIYNGPGEESISIHIDKPWDLHQRIVDGNQREQSDD